MPRKSPVNLVQQTIEDSNPSLEGRAGLGEVIHSDVPSEIIAFAKSKGYEEPDCMDWAMTMYTLVLILPTGQKITKART